ncbi:MAG: MMPL family transporter [Actinobacteria bacterium]|nr:MMPL family transporter [Actinomycetota bacterium]MDA2982146.1 MMPL family transporter [Actinomycetota bacterium]
MFSDAKSKTSKTRTIKGRKPLWLAIVVVIVWMSISSFTGPLFGKLSTVQENNNSSFLPEDSVATRAANAITKFSDSANDQIPALVLFTGEVTPEKIASTQAFAQTLGSKPIVHSDGELLKDTEGNDVSIPISDYFIDGAPITAFPSEDGEAILANFPISVQIATEFLPGSEEPALPGIVEAIRYYANEFADSNSFVTHTTGFAGILADLFGAFGSVDSTLLTTTATVVAIILIVVYRSPILWILPLLSAGIALTLAGGVVYLLAKNDVITLDGQSQGILSVLVLGAATDYALLLIARYREELHLHESRFGAMKVAWRGVVEPILASGTTVVIGLMVLLLSQLNNNRGLGPVGAIGIICSMITILTLLPALLVIFGRWIFWPKIARFGEADEKLTGAWAKVGVATERKPRRYWIGATALLIVLAGFSTTLNATGLSTIDSFTKRTDSVVGQEELLKHFPGGQGQPTQVVVKEAIAPAVIAKLGSNPGVDSVEAMFMGFAVPGEPLPPAKVVDGNMLLNVTLKYAPDSEEAIALIPGLRADMESLDKSILVGGSTSVSYDINEASKHDRNLIIPIVLFLIAIILGLLLRSIYAAVLLLATVVISFFATLGACAIVFNHIFGFAGSDPAFPLFAFIFLVALGIDYNIFLMTRVREESLKLGTRAGMTKALTVTGGVITSAGIVLAATFAVLGVLPLVFLAQLGFAVAFGVLLDTMIVRSILVPALVHEIGPKVWWPSKLQHQGK